MTRYRYMHTIYVFAINEKYFYSVYIVEVFP